MKNMKKTTYMLAIMLVIAGLMMTSAARIPVFKNTTETNGITVEKLDDEIQTLAIQTTYMDTPFKHIPQVLGDPAFAFEGDQLHPAFGRNLFGKQVAAYRDDVEQKIVWTFSADDGATYDPGVYYPDIVGGDYPSIKLWNAPGGTTFYGTFVTDFMDLNGGAVYLFGCTDPTDYATYNMIYWDFSNDGWYDMIDADIACDSSQNPWEWGFSSYVMSTTYGQGYTNGPTIVYSDPDDENSGWISWGWKNNCAHTDVDIDHKGIKGYAVFDQDKNLDGNWTLLCRVKDFEEAHQGSDSTYTITGDGNLTYPAVAVHDGNIVILAETDENGNRDIVCLYGTGIYSLETNFVASEIDDEMYPDVRHVQDETFRCTFVKGGKLYKSTTEDAGATWNTPEEVADVVEEYKTADLTDYAVKAMYGVDNGEDIDIHIEDIGDDPEIPILGITINSGFGVGVSAVITNSGNVAATNVEWNITVTGGLLGLIDKEAADTITSLAVGAEETVKSGLIVGLGPIAIIVTATCGDSSAEETADGKQIIIFTKVN